MGNGERQGRRWLVDKAIRAKASLWMSDQYFIRCCDHIGEFPENGERVGDTVLFVQDFEFGSRNDIETARFWYGYYGPDRPQVLILDIERSERDDASPLHTRVIELAVKVLDLLRRIVND